MSRLLYICPISDSDILEIKENLTKAFIFFDHKEFDNAEIFTELIEGYEEYYNLKFTDEDRKLMETWRPEIEQEIYYVPWYRVIHFLVSGSFKLERDNSPLSFLLGIHGRMPEYEINFFTSNQVRQIYKVISDISDKEIRKRVKKRIDRYLEYDHQIYLRLGSNNHSKGQWEDWETDDLLIGFNELKSTIFSYVERNTGMYVDFH